MSHEGRWCGLAVNLSIGAFINIHLVNGNEEAQARYDVIVGFNGDIDSSFMILVLLLPVLLQSMLLLYKNHPNYPRHTQRLTRLP